MLLAAGLGVLPPGAMRQEFGELRQGRKAATVNQRTGRHSFPGTWLFSCLSGDRTGWFALGFEVKRMETQ